MGVNWNNLLEQNRCKAIGVPWSDEEHKAIMELGIPADYVRNGILTKKDYEKAVSVHKEEGKPQKYLSRKEVQAEARALGVEFSEETTRPELIELVQLAREKSKNPASP